MTTEKRPLTTKEYRTAFENGIARTTVKKRYFQEGWTAEEATTLPRGYRKNPTNSKSELTKEHLRIAKENGVASYTAHNRHRLLGYSIEEAITLPHGGRRPRPITEIF